jgi:uncharacterized membrane protein YidH (DUF202 family)
MDAMTDASDIDVTRRTHLAAERTCLAWWRTGIATIAAAVGVGGVVPALVGALPRRGSAPEPGRAGADRGDFAVVSTGWVTGFTIAGTVLGLGTFAAILADA